MAMLKRLNSENPGQIVELKGDLTVIGRDPSCSIVLGLNGVSRRHALIRRKGNAYVVVDENSRNRTFVNDAVLEYGIEHPLRPNDEITICDVKFAFLDDLPPTPPPPAKPRNQMIVTDDSESTIHTTLDAARNAAAAAAVRPEAKLAAILEISRHLSSDLNMDTVAPKILDALFSIFPQAERAFLCLKEPGGGDKLIRKAFKYRQLMRRLPIGPAAVQDEPPMTLSRTIVNQVMNQKKAVLAQNAGDLPTSMSIAEMKIQSIMCVPMLAPDGQVLGIIQLDTGDRKQFGQEDLDILLAVAGQAAIAISNAAMHDSLLARERLISDLRIAEKVQKAFLPASMPTLPGYEFFAYYEATYEVGGDFYDFVPLADGRLAVALGDVSGKGVSAALMMAKFSGDNRLSIVTQNMPAAAAFALNNRFCETGIEEKFITLSLCFIDPRTDIVTFCSAGHMPLMIRRADGRVEEIGEDITKLPIGILSDLDYEQIEVQLHPGDVVLIFSDGLTDARNAKGDLFDTKLNRRIPKRVQELSGGAGAIGRALLQTIREFVANAPQADDMTLVCFGRIPEPPRTILNF